MKKLLCCICSLLLLLCSCTTNSPDKKDEKNTVNTTVNNADNVATSNAEQDDDAAIKTLVCEFSKGLMNKDSEVLAKLIKKDSQLYQMFSGRFDAKGDFLAEFKKEYTELGGNPADFDEFKEYARNISINIDQDTAKVDAELLTLGAGAKESTDGEQMYIRTEKVAHKTDSGSLEIKVEDWFSSDEDEFVGKGKYSTLSYAGISLNLEKIDNVWYISELVIE